MTDREKKRRDEIKAALIAEWNRQAQAAAMQAAGAQAAGAQAATPGGRIQRESAGNRGKANPDPQNVTNVTTIPGLVTFL